MPDIDESECLWGEDFFNTYMSHATKKSYFNKRLHQVACLSLIGQPLRNVRLRSDQTYIDCRIHPFIIQSSGTGKNSAFKLMKTVAEASGFEFNEHGKDSTAGIMGTVRRNGEVSTGDLNGNGFVAWKEAQQLIKAAKSDYSTDLLEVINQALDPSGKVSRSLSGGDLSYHSRTSLFCTTYPPDPTETDQLDLINQGFLPRTLFLYSRWSENKYDEVNERRDSNLPRPGDKNKSYNRKFEEDVEKLAKTLRYIEQAVYEFGSISRQQDSHHAQGKEHLEYFEGVEDGVSINPSPVINDVLDDYPFRIRKRVKPFKTRMYDLTYKIAACLAAVDKSKDNNIFVCRSIKERHARNAKKLVKFSFKCIVDFVEDYMTYSRNESLDKVERTVKEICMSDSGQATVQEIMRETRGRKNEVRRDLATLDEMGLIESEKPTTALETNDKVEYVEEPDNLRY